MLRFGAPALSVALRRNARVRRMVLRVPRRAGAQASLTAPPDVPLTTLRAFLTDHEAWLREKLAQVPPPIKVEIGTDVPFGDGTFRVVAGAGRRAERRAGALAVPPKAAAGPQVAAFLKTAARAALAEAVDAHAARIGRRPGRLSLRDPRGRWGSCSGAGNLMFSWRLVMAPAAVLDYVAAHEVAHLAEMNHSARFWTLVDRLCPDHAASRGWLRRFGSGLHAFDFGTRRG